jgi:hypothetical protein
MKIITNIRQLKLLIAISIIYEDKPTDEVIEMWLARVAELEEEKHENTT